MHACMHLHRAEEAAVRIFSRGNIRICLSLVSFPNPTAPKDEKDEPRPRGVWNMERATNIARKRHTFRNADVRHPKRMHALSPAKKMGRRIQAKDIITAHETCKRKGFDCDGRLVTMDATHKLAPNHHHHPCVCQEIILMLRIIASLMLKE